MLKVWSVKRACSNSAIRVKPPTISGAIAEAHILRQARCFSDTSTDTLPPPPPNTGEKLRIAICGGGCAGLSTALHLAPLVQAGYVASPIDVYDAPPSSNVSQARRDIGVGIWSSAMDPFLELVDRESHRLVYDELCKAGSFVGNVGYRVPSGAWLMHSKLPTLQHNDNDNDDNSDIPALLFLRERDLLMALQKAVHWEETHRGTIRTHSAGGNSTRVHGIDSNSTDPWSAALTFANGEIKSDHQYHLIVAADGTNSTLRLQYGGHDSIRSVRATGTSALMPASQTSPNDLPDRSHIGNSSSASWNQEQQSESVSIQDRCYTIFRGSSPYPTSDIGGFQTWGEGHRMRFATVPMTYPVNARGSEREERSVWFITTDMEDIVNETDANRRKERILEEFKDWHDPIRAIVEATPAEDILPERAIAHRHCTSPVNDFNDIVKRTDGKSPPNSGRGPVLCFIGDAYMTVDPILAQGFTCAMEGAYVLRSSVQKACYTYADDTSYAFDPFKLRSELRRRHEARIGRLINLLRSTEMVQALGQPSGGTLSGFFNTKILRPLIRVVPNFIKAPIFDAVLKYSLGWPQRPQFKLPKFKDIHKADSSVHR